jgi:hypothetical protein
MARELSGPPFVNIRVYSRTFLGFEMGDGRAFARVREGPFF